MMLQFSQNCEGSELEGEIWLKKTQYSMYVYVCMHEQILNSESINDIQSENKYLVHVVEGILTLKRNIKSRLKSQ